MNITFAGNPVTIVGNTTVREQVAPNFNAVKQDLSSFDFYAETEGKVKVISVVPSIDTGVCAIQTTTFNEEAAKLKNDVVVVTISVDLPFAQGRFCGAKGIDNLVVVSDHKALDFGEKYGFTIEEFRLLTRGIIVIDRENTVKYVEYVSEVTNQPDYHKALEAVKRLL